MPLVLMCGIPCSGKTRRAEELKSYFENECKIVVQVVDESVSPNFNRNSVYKEDSKEKELRGQLRSEVQKKLSKDVVLILDASNYIKGYRYELYCLSKASKTTHCVVSCEISQEEAWSVNEKRDGSVSYNKEIFDAMCMRFEAPDSRSRWDSPLFTVQAVDKLPLESIKDALLTRKAPPANQATQCQPLLSTNFLYDLDRITQETVKHILDAQKNAIPGDQISIAGCDIKLNLIRKFTPMELARLRRQYMVYTKMHPVEDCQKLTNMFVHYLSSGILQ